MILGLIIAAVWLFSIGPALAAGNGESALTGTELKFSASGIGTLSFDPGGEFLAAGRDGGWVDVWPLVPGARAKSFRVHKGKGTSHVVVFGEPCVVVAGAADAYEDLPQKSLVIASCRTGEIAARVKSAEESVGSLFDLVALPSCGLAVAQYDNAIVVLDVKARKVRSDLAPLFRRALKTIAAAVDDRCLLYGIAGPSIDTPIYRSMARVVEVDLARERIRTIGRLIDFSVPRGGMSGAIGWMAVSPSGGEVAVSVENPSQVDLRKPGRGTSEAQLLKVPKFGLRRFNWQAIENVVFDLDYVDEDRIVVQSTGGGPYVFDSRTGGVVSLEAEIDDLDGVRALAILASRRLVAMASDKRLHVYRLR